MKDDILILFATTTGNAEICATKTLDHVTAAGLGARMINMRDYKATDLQEEKSVLAVVSTWGDGEPPDDAIPFYEQLAKLSPGSLSKLSYSIFGLGDTAYDHFCGCAKNTDAFFQNLGARTLIERVEVDGDYDDYLQTWLETVLPVLSSSQTSNSAA